MALLLAAFSSSAVGADNLMNVQIETLAVGSSGDLAHATGVLKITGADGSKSIFNYVLVLKNVDGAWKLHLDTWTPSGK